MNSIQRQAKYIWDTRVKIKDSLGKLEDVAVQFCNIQNSLCPKIKKPVLVLASSENGIAESGVSKSDLSVTSQMTHLFENGNGSCAVMCEKAGIEMCVFNLGKSCDFSKGMAMAPEKYDELLCFGKQTALKLAQSGCNTVLLGDMGVGNTTTASALMAAITKLEVQKCLVDCNDAKLKKKRSEIIKGVIRRIPDDADIRTICSYAGGFEFVFLAGIILGAHENRIAVINDGFITSCAVLIASETDKAVLDNIVFSGFDSFFCHKNLLEYLNVSHLLDLGLRLGEGTSAVACLPLIEQSLNVFCNLKSFYETGVCCTCNQKRLPFAFGSTSYVLPDDIKNNVEYLKDKTDDIELVLFESDNQDNFPDSDLIDYLIRTAEKYNLTYTVHLPYDVKAASQDESERKHAVDTWIKVINLTACLPVHGYVIHLEPDDYSEIQPSSDIDRWNRQGEKSLRELKRRTEDLIDGSLICIETLGYDLCPYLPLLSELGFSITLDVGHLFKCGFYNSENIGKLIERTKIIHLHGVDEHNKDHKSLIAHYDKKQLDDFLSFLRKHERKNIIITLEVFNMEDFLTSIDYLKTREVLA